MSLTGAARRFSLAGLSCASCAAKVETALQQQDQIDRVRVDFTRAVLRVESSLPDQELLEVLQRIGAEVEPGLRVLPHSTGASGEGGGIPRGQWLRLAGGTLLLAGGLLLSGPLELPVVAILFYLLSYLLVGSSVVLTALRNLRAKVWFEEHLLMTLATTGALLIGEYPEAVAVMLFYLMGEMLQGRAVSKSRRAISALMDIRPDQAHRVVPGGTETVSPQRVSAGETILVRPGERVPLDSRIVSGTSFVDTSALSGEPVPRRMEPDSELLAGMVNGEGVLTATVLRPFEQSALSRILHLVETAGENKARTERFMTRFARVYTPMVFFSALLIAFLPPLLHLGSWSDWIYRGLVFLVVSCPCALLVSIPLGFFGGIGRASRQGILVKGGNYLEGLARVRTVVFDKTGTLTCGEFEVQKVLAARGGDAQQLLELAALAELHSTHPVGRSILRACTSSPNEARIDDSRELAGLGVEAHIDGEQVVVGNRLLMHRHGIGVSTQECTGTAVYVARAGTYLGCLIVSDSLRAGAKESIEQLRRLGVRHMVMLSGDRQAAVEEVATALRLDDFYAELLPEQKLDRVNALIAQQHVGRVAVVGDGVNDAPILARADIGVAMGGLGSDAAIEAADVVLMTDEPGKLVTAIETARLTERIVWQNIIMAFAAKGLVLLLGVFGLATIWQAIFADVGVTLLAVLNAIRIVR